jgi:hypothetical protein
VGRVLLAAVTDAANRPLVDLEADDFVVHEDGQEREVLSVRIADYPLVILIDNGSHAARAWSEMRAATSRFVRRVGTRSIAVVTVADPPTLVAAFEQEREATLAAIEGLEPVDHSRRRPLQALGQISTLIRDTGSAFAAVLAVTVASRGDDTEPRGLLAPFLETRDILHVVTLTAAPAPAEPAAVGPDDVLRDVATRSGGRATAIFSPVSFQIALDQIAERLASEMLVEYVAPPGAPAASDVRVGVARPGTRVRGLGVWR